MEKGGAEFYIYSTLHIVLNDRTKKNSKKQQAGILLASAVKWAEMAAHHENSRNSKFFFSLAHGHHVAS